MLEKGANDKLTDRLGPILISGMDAAQKQNISLAENELNYVLQHSDPKWAFYFLAKVTLEGIPGNLGAINSTGTDTVEKVNTTSGVESISISNLDEVSLSNSNEQLTPEHDVTGTYISEITSSSKWAFKKKYRSIEITLEQTGNNITGTNNKYQVKINGTREGNVINFIVQSNVVNSYFESAGVWTISSDGTNLEGHWKTPGLRDYAAGKWNLTKIE